MREKDIQHECCCALRDDGWIAVKIIQTTLNGWPDIQALKNNRVVFIEVKANYGKPSELQEFRHEQLRNAGFLVIVIKTMEEATNIADIISKHS